MIKVRAVVEVTQDEDGAYHVHGHDDPVIVSNAQEALTQAEEFAVEHAEAQSREMGGHALETDTDIQRIDLPNVGEDLSLIGATVTAECTSIPWRA